MAHGGKREGAGRKPGQTTAAKRDLIEMAKEHGHSAVAVLAEIMNNKAEAVSARVSAAVALLDRGYGRPTQRTEGPGPNGEHLHKVSADAAFAEIASVLDSVTPGTAIRPN